MVADESGAVLPGVTVTLKRRRRHRTAATDATGHYVIADVAPGDLRPDDRNVRFKPQASKVTVAAGQSVNLDAKLQIGGQTESIPGHRHDDSAGQPWKR